jgi:hypothetical protein
MNGNKYGFVVPKHHENYASAVQKGRLDKIFADLSGNARLPWGILPRIARGIISF